MAGMSTARARLPTFSPPRLTSRVITTRRDFETLFVGYDRLRAVSYVVSPDLLLRLFDPPGFSRVEIVVGDNLSESYRQTLREKGVPVAAALASLVADDRLTILVPRRTIHSKLYILSNDGQHRIVQGSANLTEAARNASRQINYVWCMDADDTDPWLTRVVADFESHRRECSIFMGDLAELMRRSTPSDREALVEAWLKGTAGDPDELEIRNIQRELAARALERVQGGEESIFSISLPEAPRAVRHIERILEPAGASRVDHRISVDARKYVRYVEQVHAIPLMQLDIEQSSIRLALDGRVFERVTPLTEPTLVDRALTHIERYVATVDWGRSLDAQFAKASIVEALLYVLSAPFAHEHMKSRRRAYSLIDRRGPQVLYVFGRAQNGKSTFLRFALQLLTGRHMSPLSGAQFTKTRVQAAAAVATVFPLVFDDIDLTHKSGAFEEILKSYWEVWWSDACPAPQIMLTSNTENLKDWAKSRIKRVDFDVQFASTPTQKATLNAILAEQNPLFGWFAYLYLQRSGTSDLAGDDELGIARAVMRDLYQYANRPLPEYFPQQPIEHTYDPGRKHWRDLVYGLRKATIERQGERVLVTFRDDMQVHEIRAATGHLPQTVKHQVRGKTVIVEAPDEFVTWLSDGRPKPAGWLARLWHGLWR
jgi:hypothetical protein